MLENLAAVKNIYTFNVVLVITITSGFLTKIISYIRNARLLSKDMSALVWSPKTTQNLHGISINLRACKKKTTTNLKKPVYKQTFTQ